MNANPSALESPMLNEKEQLIELLSDIQEKSSAFQKGILTEDEREEIAETAESLDVKVREAAYAVLKNLEEYQHNGWQEFIGGEDGGNGNFHRVI